MTDPYSDLLGIETVAEVAGVSVPSIRKYRAAGKFPLPVVGGGGGGRQLLWSRADVDEWLAEHRPAGRWPVPA
jgi:predicted DNA-binding transcriptional regulator AlpA